ncbi:MAG: cell wall hydrolase [Patescibacteria group bacterium]|jgi:hypothetical protein
MFKYLFFFILITSPVYSYEYSFEEIEVAKVICAEACGEGEIGMQAVANVINNRAKLWNKSHYQIVIQQNQFFGYIANNKNKLYNQCKLYSLYIIDNIDNIDDITNGAIYFLKEGERKGEWIGEKTVTIGKHTFYKEKE